jgi:hypothetical protein
MAKMKLNKTYAIGVLVMFYEIEMLPDYIDGIINMTQDIENKDNIVLHFAFSMNENLEKIDRSKINEEQLEHDFQKQLNRLKEVGLNQISVDIKYKHDDVYSIAHARRDFNYEFADKVDYLMWGETDSFFPKETFEVTERISLYVNSVKLPKHVVTFAYRKMWDKGWAIMEHPRFTNETFQDTDEWNLHNKARTEK